jgi:hypothetical protein
VAAQLARLEEAQLGHLEEAQLGHLEEAQLGHLEEAQLGHPAEAPLGHPGMPEDRRKRGRVILTRDSRRAVIANRVRGLRRLRRPRELDPVRLAGTTTADRSARRVIEARRVPRAAIAREDVPDEYPSTELGFRSVVRGAFACR